MVDINVEVSQGQQIGVELSIAGARNFLQLTDSPSVYAGQAGKAVLVNVGEDALEFGDVSVSVIWSDITGDQSVVNLSGFTNDSGFITNLSSFDTDDLTEGSTNLYDKTVAFTGGSNVTIGGTYPNFTLTDNSASDSDLTTHISDTTTHGTTGDIVGTTDTQTLDNKKLIDLNTQFIDNLDNSKEAQFELVNLTASSTRILTLQDKDIVIADNADVTAHTSAGNIHFLEGDIDHVNINSIGTNTHAQLDTHLASTTNPHGTDIGNLGTGTLAELNTKITDATLDDSSDTRTPSAHVSTHENGGGDELSVTGLSGELADAQKITVRKNTGSDVGTRGRLNFIEGANTTLTVVDDSGSGEVDITIASTGGGASPLTTKGDIYTFSTADDRLPVGTNGQVLLADSAQSLGIKWGAPGAAPVDSVFSRTGVVVAETNDYTFAQIDKTVSDLADLTTKSHNSLTDKGTNTHAQIDTHIADGTLHFTESSIDHTVITNIGSNSHSDIDSHISGTTEHGATGAVVGTTNTQTLSNKKLVDLNTRLIDNLDSSKSAGFELVNLTTSTERILTLQDKDIVIADNADVTSHTSASNIHFLESAISIPASQISDFDAEVSNNSSVSDNTTHTSSDGKDHSDVVTNNSKVSNVTTNLSEGTSTTTTVDVNSSDGTNATLVSASTSRAGVMTKSKFDEVVANNAKVSFTKTNVKGTINHGATAGTARPSGFDSVEWIGTVEPTNATNDDTWIDTT